MSTITSYKIEYDEVINATSKTMLVIKRAKTYHWLDFRLFNADLDNLRHQKDAINIRATIEKEYR